MNHAIKPLAPLTLEEIRDAVESIQRIPVLVRFEVALDVWEMLRRFLPGVLDGAKMNPETCIPIGLNGVPVVIDRALLPGFARAVYSDGATVLFEAGR